MFSQHILWKNPNEFFDQTIINTWTGKFSEKIRQEKFKDKGKLEASSGKRIVILEENRTGNAV